MSRRSKIFAVMTAFAVVLMAIGLLLLPEFVRRTAIAHLEDQLQMRVTIADVDLNVFTGRVALTDLSLFRAIGDRPSLSLQRADLKLSLWALLRRRDVLTAELDLGPARIFLPGMEQPVFTVSRASAPAIHIDFPNQRVRLAELSLTGPSLRIERDPKGEWSLGKFFGDGSRAEAHSEHPSDAGWGSIPLNAEIARLRVRAGALGLVDRTVSPAVTTAVRDWNVDIKGLALDAKVPATIEGGGRIEGGTLEFKGNLRLIPFATELTVTAADIPLETFRGYAESALRPLSLRGGSAHGVIGVASEPENVLSLSGRAEIANLALGIGEAADPVLLTERVKIDLRRARLHPSPRIDLAAVAIEKANLRLERKSDGSLNLAPLLETPAEGGAEEISPSKSAGPSPFRLRALEIADSRIDFVDRSVKPVFKTALSQMSLRVGDLGRKKSPLKISASLDGAASLELSGAVQASERTVGLELEGEIRDYDLSAIAPYAIKYVEYEIERGRVTSAVKYHYHEGQLVGENQIEVRHLLLGEKLGREFEEQVGVPLNLAVALLTDVDGRIRLSIPMKLDVQGTSVSPDVFWPVLRNSLIKVLTVPLRLLGSIVTVGGRIGEIRIDPVEFVTGSVELTAEGRQQLRELAGFLKQKPHMELQLQGYSAASEAMELKRRLAIEQIEPQAGETYAQAVARIYRAAGGTLAGSRPPSLQSMETYLAERVDLPDEALEKLAQSRVQLVLESLAGLGVEARRLFASAATEKEPGPEVAGRVEFSLLY